MAAVRFDYGPADGQSHTSALRLSCEERIEDFLLVFWPQSHTGIADRYQDVGFAFSPRRDRKPTTRTFILHGFDAVEYQIHENLLYLDTISIDAGEAVAQFAMDTNGIPRCLNAQQRDHLLNNLIHFDQRSEEHTSELQSLAYIVCR